MGRLYNYHMDWPQKIIDVRTTGMTQVQIARHCGCSQTTVSLLLAGTTRNPSWLVGQALTALHAELYPPESAVLGMARLLCAQHLADLRDTGQLSFINEGSWMR